MPKGEYEIFEALNPFFEVVMEGLRGLVDGDHYFDTIAEDAFFEFRYHFPGWPLTIRGRANLMASFSGYGKTIKLHSGDALVVHRSQDSRVVILEYEVHGKILSGGAPYDNRFISVVTIDNRKIVQLWFYHGNIASPVSGGFVLKLWHFNSLCHPRNVRRSELSRSPLAGILH